MNKPLELAKAIVILALGVGMLIAPGIGDDDAATLPTLHRMLAWAWSRPLGIVFTAVGLIGLYALLLADRRTSPAT